MWPIRLGLGRAVVWRLGMEPLSFVEWKHGGEDSTAVSFLSNVVMRRRGLRKLCDHLCSSSFFLPFVFGQKIILTILPRKKSADFWNHGCSSKPRCRSRAAVPPPSSTPTFSQTHPHFTPTQSQSRRHDPPFLPDSAET